MKIKDLPSNNRPREKALLFGIDSLNDIELLALIIKNGNKKYSAIDIAGQLISKYHNIKGVIEAPFNELQETYGINKIKALDIKVIYYLFKRIDYYNEIHYHLKVRSGKDIYEHYKYLLNKTSQENFYIIYLNNQNYIIKDELLSLGNDDSVNINIRFICQKVLESKAKKVILIHNHPEGNSTPSNNDLKMTVAIKDALNLIGIKLLDHIVIGKKEFYSINDNIKVKM